MLLYSYISRFSVNPHYISRGRKSGKAAAINFIPQPFFILLFNFSHKRPTFAFTAESGYTLGFPRKIAHSGLHAETGGVSDGGGITTLGAFRTFTNIPGPGIRTASFAAFGAWSGAPKERRKPSEQRCAYARRCSEASRPRWAAQPLLWSSWLSCFCLKPLLQTALRHGTMVSPNRKP